MTIRVSGTPGTSEHGAASALRSLVLDAWPDLETSADDVVEIVSSVKCYGESTQDIDVALFARFADVRRCGGFGVRSLALVFEVKSHTAGDVEFVGNRVRVRYRDEWHCCAEQSHRQRMSMASYVKKHLGRSPFVANLVWLPNCPVDGVPGDANVVGMKATLADILSKAVHASGLRAHRGPSGPNELRSFTGSDDEAADLFDGVTRLFARTLEPSFLDQKKIDRISKEKTKGQQYEAKLGQQLLLFRGRGGTGKTFNLLRLAYHLYERGDRVLLLTYNKALVADLERLLSLMGVRDGVAVASIQVRTIHAWLRKVFVALQLMERNEPRFLERYGELKAALLQRLRSLPKVEVQRTLQGSDGALAFDHVFIDEGQDWPSDERDLLFALFDHRQLVVADGMDQLVRRASVLLVLNIQAKVHPVRTALERATNECGDLVEWIETR